MGNNPRGFYWGWYVVLGTFLILGINYGARYSFGVFVKPMVLEYHWSRSVISAGMSILILAYGIGGIFSGRLVDRIAPRWLITAGAALMAIGAASIGVGVATMVLAPLAGWVVKVYGWRVGFFGLGGVVLVIGVGLSQCFMGKTRPEDYGLLPDGGGGTERGAIRPQTADRGSGRPSGRSSGTPGSGYWPSVTASR